jgi:hypothetical protein
LEITWFEETDEAGVYKEGDEDEVTPGTVICVTKLEVGHDSAPLRLSTIRNLEPCLLFLGPRIGKMETP